MKRCLLIAIVVLSVCVGRAVAEGPSFSIGVKAWELDAEVASDTATLAGIAGSVDITDSVWISGLFMAGTLTVPMIFEDDEITVSDGELFAGYSFAYLDLGGGFRYSTWEFWIGDTGEGFEECAIYGPTIYVGTGSVFGDTPLGWYAGASWMFLDLGDTEDKLGESQEHFNFELGLFVSWQYFGATLGYRERSYPGGPFDISDLSGGGPALSASLKF